MIEVVDPSYKPIYSGRIDAVLLNVSFATEVKSVYISQDLGHSL
jgi:hypothetical protein